jgi:hypothetical protein
MSKKTSDKYHLKIELGKEEFKMFSEIQEHYNIKNKTDVLRLCIKDAYRIMKRREQLLSDMA